MQNINITKNMKTTCSVFVSSQKDCLFLDRAYDENQLWLPFSEHQFAFYGIKHENYDPIKLHYRMVNQEDKHGEFLWNWYNKEKLRIYYGGLNIDYLYETEETPYQHVLPFVEYNNAVEREGFYKQWISSKDRDRFTTWEEDPFGNRYILMVLSNIEYLIRQILQDNCRYQYYARHGYYYFQRKSDRDNIILVLKMMDIDL